MQVKKIWVSLLRYLGVTLLVLLWICRSCFRDPAGYASTIGFTFLLTVLLFEGNGWLNHWVGQKVSWVEKPVLRTVLGVGITVLYTCLLVTLVYMAIFIWGKGGSMADYKSALLNTLLISMVITLLVSLALHARQFLFHWREAALRLEKLKNEQMNSRLASLKAQLNPHFLFNSLNALTALVYKDADQAAAFIKKLSEMYRYILDYVDEEVVSLEKELYCLDAYIFLLKIRHGDHLEVVVEVGESDFFIPPLSLQMLMENATKHNVISHRRPLKVEVKVDGEVIRVRNNRQPKEVEVAKSGKGLANIRARYELLTDKSVEVITSDDLFEVSLPLLSFGSNKHTYSTNKSTKL